MFTGELAAVYLTGVPSPAGAIATLKRQDDARLADELDPAVSDAACAIVAGAIRNPERHHMGDVVKALTDEALADRLRKATDRARGFSVAEREAFMREAASRLEAAHVDRLRYEAERAEGRR